MIRAKHEQAGHGSGVRQDNCNPLAATTKCRPTHSKFRPKTGSTRTCVGILASPTTRAIRILDAQRIGVRSRARCDTDAHAGFVRAASCLCDVAGPIAQIATAAVPVTGATGHRRWRCQQRALAVGHMKLYVKDIFTRDGRTKMHSTAQHTQHSTARANLGPPLQWRMPFAQ